MGVRRAQVPLALAFFVPFLSGLWHQNAGALYRTDAALLQMQGLAPSLSGSLSALLARGATALPLGDVVARAAALSALLLGLSGMLVFLVSMRLLRREGSGSECDPWLSLGGALMATATLPGLTEGTIAGGGALGLCLALYWLHLDGQLKRGSSFSNAALRGALTVALLVESPALALGLLFTSFLPRFFRNLGHIELQNIRPPEKRSSSPEVGFGLGALLLFGGLVLSEALAAGKGGLAGLVEIRSWTLSEEARASVLWPLSELGLLWSIAALVGLLSLGVRRSPALWVPLGIFALDLVVPRSGPGGWLDPELTASRAALHLTTIALLAPLGALGLRVAALLGPALRLPASRMSAALLTTLGVAAALAGVEEAANIARRTSTLAIRVSGEELMRQLPPSSLIVATSERLSRRLLAVQALGERPDVLVVPLEFLGDAYRFGALVRAEPVLERLVVDMNVSGAPSEEALFRLTDVRPVYIEPDPKWEPKLLAHLEPTPVLARYSPHTLSGPERRVIYAREENAFKELLGLTELGVEGDPATRRLLVERHETLRRAIERAGDSATAELMALATL